MNVNQAKAYAKARNMEITADHTLNGKTYFIVIDTTNDEAVIVNRASRVWWRPEGATCNHLRGVAIEVAITALLSRRNK